MGGFGSGRTAGFGRDKVEHSRSIDVNWLHRNDTAVEAAKVPDIEAVSGKRSLLSRGNVLRALLTNGRTKNYTIRPPGHVNCLRCRAPRASADWIGQHRSLRPTFGNRGASNAVCNAWMQRPPARRPNRGGRR